MPSLGSVHIYPVKGCYRSDLPGARVEPWGLAGDRRWLVTDRHGRLLTQREEPALARIRPLPRADGGVTLRAPGQPELVVAAGDGEPTEVTVHRDRVAVVSTGERVREWFTGALGRPARLFRLADPTRRPVDPAYGRPDDRVSLADGYPLLVTNAASLAALNGWLREAGSPEGPLPMTRFRPNLVVSGAAAWAEDGWLGRRLRVGAVTFRAVKPCGRCVVTTTDQESGQRGREPLVTLARHRKADGRLLFGVNLIPDPPYGEVSVGDRVELLE